MAAPAGCCEYMTATAEVADSSYGLSQPRRWIDVELRIDSSAVAVWKPKERASEVGGGKGELVFVTTVGKLDWGVPASEGGKWSS